MKPIVATKPAPAPSKGGCKCNPCTCNPCKC
jgi:hypothetical protein